MKQLLISIAALGIVLTSVVFFNIYANRQLDAISKTCEAEIVSLIEDDNWNEAFITINSQYKKWSDFKKYSVFFKDANEISEIDSCFRKTIMYISAQDKSNSNGELVYLASEINYLNKKENVSLKNIL